MAVITTLTSTKVSIKLDDGYTTTGAVKTVSVPFPSLNKDAFDADKVMAIVGKLSSVLNKAVFRIVKSDETDLEDE